MIDITNAAGYYLSVIMTFGDDETRRIFQRTTSRKLPADIQRVARRKLIYLDSARDLRDLLVPPGNQMEALKGDRKGQHSIRINDQWRICFTWRTTGLSGTEAEQEPDAGSVGGAYDVEIVDYH